MFYKSTRNSSVNVTSAQAITQGISKDGGLFVPSELPAVTMKDIKELGDMTYAQRAFFVFSKFLTDFKPDEIRYCVDSAYNDKNFDTDSIAELAHLFDGTYMLDCGTVPPALSRIWRSRSCLICSPPPLRSLTWARR